MIDLALMITLQEINAKLKHTTTSYALLGNNSNLQLFRSDNGDVTEMCQCNARTMKTVLTTINNSLTRKEATK